jgi:WhiB family transcriptional regulator, redox-sensing transcriptional regulator
VTTVVARVVTGTLHYLPSDGRPGIVTRIVRVNNAVRWRCDVVSVVAAVQPVAVAGHDDDWRERAACRGLDPDLFYPERGADPKPAQRICADCPVREECLDYAMERREIGIWGGTSEQERRRMKRRRRLAVSA